MQTARDFLISTFGATASLISQIDAFGDTTVSGASFVIDKHGDDSNYCAFVACGGEAIIRLSRDHTVDKRPMYVVLDRDNERSARAAKDRAWRKATEDRHNMTKNDWHDYHRPIPFPVMRLVQSA